MSGEQYNWHHQAQELFALRVKATSVVARPEIEAQEAMRAGTNGVCKITRDMHGKTTCTKMALLYYNGIFQPNERYSAVPL